jgi:ADP-ribosylglycohydrolase
MTAAEHCLQRARVALEGLSVGDAFGAHLEFTTYQMLKRVVEQGWLPKPPWRYTDDTNMALSIYQLLRENGVIDQDKLAASFAKRYERGRGYGAGASRLMKQINAGEYWRDVTPHMFSGQGSYGNGAAMRIAPLGAYFAHDLDACVENARLSSEVTHSHPEGIAGGIAVAVAAAHVASAENVEKARAGYFEIVLERTPESEVRSKIRQVSELRSKTPLHVAQQVGNGAAVSAQDTVPFVLWSAHTFLDDYEQSMWQTASVGGDVDTTCAMVGGIVACALGWDGIPHTWRDSRETLPQWSLGGT